MPLSVRVRFVRSIVCFGLLALSFSGQRLAAQEEPIWSEPVEKVTNFEPGELQAQLAQASSLIKATQARAKYGVDGSGLVVAVLDTGINSSHVDFGGGRIVGGRNYTTADSSNPTIYIDRNGHGTNCAGIVMANGTQNSGIAPGASVYVYKVLGDSGSGQFAWMRDALIHLRDNRVSLGVTAVNMSIGDGQNHTSVPNTAVFLEIQTLINELRAAGVVFCVSAGNSFYTWNSAQGMGFPAICPSATSVGAVFDANIGGVSYSSGAVAFSSGPKRLTPFSQRIHSSFSSTFKTDMFATGAALTAPGIPNSTSLSTYHGTSQASPCIAGVALLIQDYYRERTGTLPTVAQVEGWMLASSEGLLDGDDEDDNVSNTNLTFPFVNAEAALDLVHEATNGVNNPPTIVSAVAPGAILTVTAGDEIEVDFQGLDQDGDQLTLEIDGLPSGATLDPPAGTSQTPPFDATLSWTTDASDVGLHPITIRYRDDDDSTAQRSFSIDVLPGTAKPQIAPLVPVTVECIAGAHFVALKATCSDPDDHPLTATWKVNGQVVLTEAVGSDGETVYSANYEHGVHSVDVTVDDDIDGTATAGTTVTVRDTQAPVIVVAANMIVLTDPGESFASNVVLTPPVVSDAAGHGYTLTDDAPDFYPIGETIVSWTATDEEGNVATATQKVTVLDLESPVLEEPSPRRLRLNCDRGKKFATVRLIAPQATDNASGVKVKRSPASNRFPIGKTKVIWTATDASGNVVRKTQWLVVLNRQPVARAGADIVVETNSERGAYVELDGRKSYDPDGHRIKYLWSAAFVKWSGVKSSTPSGIFPIGSSSVTLAVTDSAGAKKSDIVRVVVKLKRGRPRSSGEDANLAFAQAENSARQALAGEAGAPAATGFAYAGLASACGDAAGEVVRWEEGASDSDAALVYAEMRALQRTYGEAAAGELFSAYAETGDEALYSAYLYALHGTASASADLQEP